MTGPWNSPSPEFAKAAHPELEDLHYPEKASILQDSKIAKSLRLRLVIAAVVIGTVAAILLLVMFM